MFIELTVIEKAVGFINTMLAINYKLTTKLTPLIPLNMVKHCGSDIVYILVGPTWFGACVRG